MRERGRVSILVAGGGPAGALTGLLCARAGLDVLLVERAVFPRAKTCGGTLNGRALAALSGAGLGTVPVDLGASRLDSFELFVPPNRATLALPGLRGIGRDSLDTALLSAAQKSGVRVLSPARVSAVVPDEEGWRVAVAEGGEAANRVDYFARVVVCACGLNVPWLETLPGFTSVSRPQARVGVGTVIPEENWSVPESRLIMAWSPWGYAGAARVDGGRIDAAAAIDPEAIHRFGSVSHGVRAIFEYARAPAPPGLADAHWLGTPPLTRRRERLAGERLFVVGDAAGYAEPFTGEGLAWALGGAVLLAPLAAEAARAWRPQLAADWTRLHGRQIANHQRACGVLARVLRSARLSQAACGLIGAIPALAAPLLGWMNGPELDGLSRRLG